MPIYIPSCLPSSNIDLPDGDRKHFSPCWEHQGTRQESFSSWRELVEVVSAFIEFKTRPI